ncbi:MAG: murein biosynthesis integral membrane protein MurJ [Alphaproteobacteria bacterium HGW-Alphaproteobacteria-1]|jgi:putative peptidoglycan lipid II flippase|nr:MAG: murein biosynthesis integral membrane protein MurJ [Alphaproteobacteria bacterium HGW-Alphaproteobacteria-1]
MKSARLLSGILTVSGWTLLSRVLGFGRDVMLASLVGPGVLMDAFVAAFRLPNMFRRFFAEGAFNAAFVPMFAKRLEGEGDAIGFASRALSGLGFVLLILTGLGMVFMPGLVWLTAEGFAGDARFGLTVDYGRIAFPYIFFISLVALFSGVLNAAGRFAAAAAAPVLLNTITMAAMALAAWRGGPVVEALIWSVPLAGAAQLVLVWVAARKAGLGLGLVRPRWTPEMRHLVRIAVPAALAGGVVQVNLVVGQVVASNYDKAVSWLYSADRLYQLPLGVVGIAVGIVLLPDLSRRLKTGDYRGARMALSRAGEVALALTVPCAVALMVIPLPLVSVLFERGNFSADDTAATALAVAVYSFGLPAFVMQKILQPVYFAREDTKSPFRYAVVAMVVNAVLAFGLAGSMGWIAAALATTVAAWFMVVQLVIGARGYGEVVRFDAQFHRRLWRIVLASGVMGVVLWGGELALGPLLALGGWRWLALLALIGAGAASYGIVGQVLGAFSMAEIRGRMRR